MNNKIHDNENYLKEEKYQAQRKSLQSNTIDTTPINKNVYNDK